MNFKDMLETLSMLSEATKETEKGRVHKAEPGGYGRKYDTDEEGEEKDGDKDAKKPQEKRSRGRPAKTGAHVSSPAEKKKQKDKEEASKNLQSFIVGNVPKKPSKELKNLPSKKHSLKEFFDQIDQERLIKEATPGQALQVKPMPGASQLVDPATQKVVATGRADKIAAMQKSMAQGEVQMPGKMEEGSDDYSAKKARAGKDIGKPGKAFGKIAKDAGERYGSKAAGERVAGAVLAKLRKGVNEAERPSDDADLGAGLGAGRSQTTFEGRAKADNKAEKAGEKVTKDIEYDEKKKDGIHGKKRGAEDEKAEKAGKKVAKDIEYDEKKDKKKKVNESMHRHSSARLMGKAHALAKEAYNCRYEDMEEAKAYHDGFKEGLDECYGQGVYETAPVMPPSTMSGMAHAAMEDDLDEMDKTSYMKQQAIKTPGPTFKAFGQTMYDKDVLETSLAFESLDKQLHDLLTEGEVVEEGMSVSISKGNQGAPDSVTVSAQDSEAEKLLSFIKQTGLGLFGDENHSNYGAPTGETPKHAHGDIEVVDDHDGMMSIMKKLSGMDQGDDGDYRDEEHHDDHGHEDECNECGYMESDCQCDEEAVVDEDESYGQEEEEVAEDNPPDSDEAETSADENAEAEEDEALARADELKEWANQVGKGPGKGTDASFEEDIEFMTKIIAGGLNKPKATGQTTIPVIPGQDARTGYEDISAWKKLAGI